MRQMPDLADSPPVRAVRSWLLRAALRLRRGGSGDIAGLVARLPEEARVLLRRDGLDPVPALTDGPSVRPVRLPLGIRGVVVTGYDEARTVLADSRTFSNDFGHLVGRAGIDSHQDPGGLGMCDPPEHTRLRRMLAPEFTVRRLQRMRPVVEGIVHDRLDALEAAADGDGRVDLWAQFALPVPALTIADLLGLSPEDRRRLQDLSLPRFDVAAGTDRPLAAVGRSLDHLREVIARERRAPGPGLLGSLLSAHGDELSDDVLAGMADGLVTGGLETTASMLALGTLALAEDPTAGAVLRDGADPGPVVDALLRRLSVVQVAFPRFARTEAFVGPHRVRPGDAVLLSLSGANREPAHAHDPHLAFGHGLHRCLGAELARLELGIALPALLQRFPRLRPAVPADRLPYRPLSIVYGVDALPVLLA